MRSNLPNFKYNPNAFSIGIFEKVPKQNCAVCHNDTHYIYSGPFYSMDDVNHICPWCIHDGKATKDFNGVLQRTVEYKNKLLSVTFNDDTNEYMYFIDYEEVERMDDESLEELIFRTPGYVAWQEPQWLSHCDEYCMFIGYLNKNELHGMKEDLQDEIRRFRGELRLICKQNRR
ncbi:CbrC family protein [Paenibacillus apiarius]|uniref:CbrC family protein n=1 Tax=Paenibacillus apiarius TaxID=46240 RepID=A0ABT4E1X5_9BACL|nr:CbrC family protein [Paenibacillus apiarius]MCY9517931.1 CbrC family protein [Paenibacillus apiarius]MCY9523505.1 CbrC family protein [Paenibacillus apiarius]MCY9555511.1 CbrC family protein [Paenibacillus apiarius]MCY9561527.1 CbrC family protein [Paenibacillus apiarius]MCY9686726.1 CbrC family protein [Paenibacillus apiarius]